MKKNNSQVLSRLLEKIINNDNKEKKVLYFFAIGLIYHIKNRKPSVSEGFCLIWKAEIV